MLDQYTDNPILLGVLGGSALLLLLVGLMALSRRNAMKEAELQESLLASQREDDLGLPGNYPAEPVDLGAPIADADAAQESVEPVSPATADPLAEADIYIAYGRFNQAAELLQAALNDEPQRTDLRLKLMEVYAELGDRDGFARQEAELRDIDAVGSSAQVEQLKFKYPAMAVGAVVAGAAASQTELDSSIWMSCSWMICPLHPARTWMTLSISVSMIWMLSSVPRALVPQNWIPAPTSSLKRVLRPTLPVVQMSRSSMPSLWSCRKKARRRPASTKSLVTSLSIWMTPSDRPVIWER